MNTLLRRSSFAFLICASFLPLLLRAQPFEGTVTWETSVPMLGDQKLVMSVSMKGDKSLSSTDIPNMGSMKTYFDKSTNKTIVVQEAQKMGTEIDMDQMDAAMGSKKFSDPKATGKKETIKGLASEEYTSTLGEGMEFDLWVTKEMPKDITNAINRSMESSMQLGGTKNEAFKQLFNKGYTPVRITIKKDGDVQATIEFSKVEPKKIDDKIFIIPSDITIKKMEPTMQQGDDSAAQPKDTMMAPPPVMKKN